MQHLHMSKRQVIHRDLKPGNILVTKLDSNLIPKIADFDYSRLLSSSNGVTKSTATIDYAAPEQLAAPDVKTEYSAKSDVWAYGAILFFLLTGKHPFGEDNGTLKTRRLKKQVTIKFDLVDQLPTEPFTAVMVDVMRKCLQDDPRPRPTFDQIDYEFQKFFEKQNPHDGQNTSNNIQ